MHQTSRASYRHSSASHAYTARRSVRRVSGSVNTTEIGCSCVTTTIAVEAAADARRAEGWKMYQQAKAGYDLVLALTNGAKGQVSGALFYDAELFDPRVAERMLGHLETLLAGGRIRNSPFTECWKAVG